MLGTSLVGECDLKNIAYDAPRSSSLDIRKKGDVQRYISMHNSSAIINCAAWTDVENSEIDFQKTYDLNAQAVQDIALAAKEAGIPVIHISTDYVFDGTKEGMYSESDVTSPINGYGASKLEGEHNLLEVLSENSYIIRTSWLYGISGKNFVKSILMKALARERIKVVEDQIGSPTNSEDLARGILSVLEREPPPGIYHFCNKGEISWYEFARKIYELVGVEVQMVEPVDSGSYSSKVRRPAHSVLSTDKWNKSEITKIIPWDESLIQIFPRILQAVRIEVKL